MLNLIINPLVSPDLDLKKWMNDTINEMDKIFIPATSYYLVKRKLLKSAREDATSRLDKLLEVFECKCITQKTLDNAAEYWSKSELKNLDIPELKILLLAQVKELALEGYQVFIAKYSHHEIIISEPFSVQ